MTYTRWTEKENEQKLIDAVAQSKSVAGICKILGLRPVGGNYKTIKHHIARLDLDVEHHTGQGWNKENYINPDANSAKATWKLHLIRKFGHQCMSCKNTTWLDLPITLELEHIDGNSFNNVENNFKLLCPNCHALTSTWRRRKTMPL